MNYRALGDTGIYVSEIGFGAWGIGGIVKDAVAYGPTDDKVSRLALKKAFEKGVTFFDTSPVYGYGHSEELIGQSLQQERDKIILATKVGYVNFSGEKDFSPAYIRKSLEDSLRRLRTDYIDILQLHDPVPEELAITPEIISTLEDLHQEGKVRVLAVSLKSPNDVFDVLGIYPFKAIQINFSLIDQRASQNGVFEKCKALGVGVIGRTPLCFGFLTGHYDGQNIFHQSDHRYRWQPEQIEAWVNSINLFVQQLPDNEQYTKAQFALRFCLSEPNLSTTIPGMLTPEQVEENIQSSELPPFSEVLVKNLLNVYANNDFYIK